MLQKPHFIALIWIVLLVLVLLNLPGEASARFKAAISGFFLPLFGLAGTADQGLDKAANYVLPRRDLIRQYEQLLREREEWRVQQMHYEEVLRENAQLREQIGWQKQEPRKVRLARVIARDPSNWWRSLQIDLGKRDGIRINMPVMTREGLVGRVSAVSEARAQVLLLGDPNLRVGALVEETDRTKDRETGVITAQSSKPLQQEIVNLSYLSGSSSVRPGQTIVTSGEGGVFPKGIPVGRVVDVRTIDYGVSVEARVKLSADMNALEQVWVVLP